MDALNTPIDLCCTIQAILMDGACIRAFEGRGKERGEKEATWGAPDSWWDSTLAPEQGQLTTAGLCVCVCVELIFSAMTAPVRLAPNPSTHTLTHTHTHPVVVICTGRKQPLVLCSEVLDVWGSGELSSSSFGPLTFPTAAVLFNYCTDPFFILIKAFISTKVPLMIFSFFLYVLLPSWSVLKLCQISYSLHCAQLKRKL